MSVFAWYYSRDVLFFPSSNADTCFQETAKRIEAVFHTQCDDYHNALTEVVRKQRWQREKAESDTRRRLMYLIRAHELALLSSRSIIWLLTQLELHLPLHESLHCAVMSHTHTHIHWMWRALCWVRFGGDGLPWVNRPLGRDFTTSIWYHPRLYGFTQKLTFECLLNLLTSLE